MWLRARAAVVCNTSAVRQHVAAQQLLMCVDKSAGTVLRSATHLAQFIAGRGAEHGDTAGAGREHAAGVAAKAAVDAQVA